MIEIDREHPEYTTERRKLDLYRDLYVGGELMKRKAHIHLLRRQKEPLDVYSERLHRAFYQNYIGSIIDWFGATLFRRAPSIQFQEGLDSGKKFLAQFADDCDQRGTGISTFFRECFTEALTVGTSHILLDFPQFTAFANNRAEEDAAGISRAFLVRYTAESLINWSLNERGEYDWVVLRHENKRQPSVDSPEMRTETTWTYYDKRQFRKYIRIGDGKDDPIDLVASGPHCLSREGRVPLFTMRFSEGLWLMNKAAHLQLEHFNKSNALAWAITMGLFAMPVIYSDREWNQIVGESYYVQLGPQDRFGWTEPDGKVYQIAAANLETLKEEIYRVCYLAQASGEMTGGHSQSALSKQMDFTITYEVLRSYAASVKDCITRVLRAVSDARQDGVKLSVSGLDEVDISDFAGELADAKNLLALGIASPTLKKQIYERLAFKYLSDVRQEMKDQIAREIQEQLD